jgi:nickel-dependent lactate racemase
MKGLVGKGSMQRALTPDEVKDICASALEDLPLDGKRVLVLIPDHTRHAPIGLFFRVLGDLLQPRVAALDYLIATGTHAAMSMERIYRHTELTAEEHQNRYPKVKFYNHEHKDLSSLISLGTLPGAEVKGLTNGLFDQDVPITINRMAVEYDHILIVSPVVPHEAMGFAGGNKYFFPGIAGLDVVERFHWLAAVITNPVVNGVKDTPTRRVIDRVVEYLKTPRHCFAFAVNDQHELSCLFAGEPREAWSHAADYSARLHIKYLDKPYKRVLGLTPPIYEEIWVAGKAMYKLEPIVAEGGELVIHGPHIKEISFMHGKDIARIGYHVRDYFVKQWKRFADEPKLILAHSTNVKGIGSFEGGVEEPRVNVTLATSITRETCEQINLGYRDIDSIDVASWEADEDTLVVHEAGQVLYRLRDGSESSVNEDHAT